MGAQPTAARGNLGKEVSMKEKSIEMAKCVLVYCIGLFIMW